MCREIAKRQVFDLADLIWENFAVGEFHAAPDFPFCFAQKGLRMIAPGSFA